MTSKAQILQAIGKSAGKEILTSQSASGESELNWTVLIVIAVVICSILCCCSLSNAYLLYTKKECFSDIDVDEFETPTWNWPAIICFSLIVALGVYLYVSKRR